MSPDLNGVGNSAFHSTDVVAPTKNAKKSSFQIQTKKKVEISYERLVWFVFILLTLLCIADRFVGSGDALLNRSGLNIISLKVCVFLLNFSLRQLKYRKSQFIRPNIHS